MAEPLQSDPARLAAGTKAPHSGIYRVYHYRHRMPHSVIVLKDDPLPACHYCGARVEFVELMDGDVAASDYDFGPEAADSDEEAA
jgi:hypothetical protein